MARHPRCAIAVQLPELAPGDRVWAGPLSGVASRLDTIRWSGKYHYQLEGAPRLYRRTDGTAADNEAFRIWPEAWGEGWRPGAAPQEVSPCVR